MNTLQKPKHQPSIRLYKEQLVKEVGLATALDGAIGVDELRNSRGQTVNALLELLERFGYDREEALNEALRELGLED